jgi:hypothetical protein
MNNLRHPNFILAIISTIILLFGIGFQANGYAFGDYVIGFAVLLGAVHWIWAIIDVMKRADLKAFQKRFWLIAVVACPILGGMLFYAMHQERDKIVT